MEQPRFKFGDRVFFERGIPLGFVVTHISINRHGHYWYEGNCKTGAIESELKLYQEPQRKKLYAFISGEQEIGFKTRETWCKDGDPSPCFWIRCPEYDIEYPEVKNEL